MGLSLSPGHAVAFQLSAAAAHKHLQEQELVKESKVVVWKVARQGRKEGREITGRKEVKGTDRNWEVPGAALFDGPLYTNTSTLAPQFLPTSH